MKNVLLVAYTFPPLGGIGAIRTLQFAKYLPHFGWRPIILTVEQGNTFVRDESLGASVVADLPVYRARTVEPLSVSRLKQAADRVQSTARGGWSTRLRQPLKRLYFSLAVPDEKIGWLPFATRKGLEIIERERIDAIFATMLPYTNLLVGRALKRRTGLPFIADYRDEWSTNLYRDMQINPLSRQLHVRLERSVLNQVDALVAATAPIVPRLAEAGLLPATTPRAVIHNGFDVENYRSTEPLDLGQQLSIVYTGSFYGTRRTPEFFLRALAAMLDERPDARARLRVYIVGTIVERHAQFIRDLALSDVVERVGNVPHDEAVRYQLGADVLLLVIGKGAGSHVVLTGKVFEYLGARRPILALVPTDGPAAALVERTRTGVVVDPEDVDGIRRALHALYDQWAAGGISYVPDEDEVDVYSRRRLTQKLAALLDSVTTNEPAAASP